MAKQDNKLVDVTNKIIECEPITVLKLLFFIVVIIAIKMYLIPSLQAQLILSAILSSMLMEEYFAYILMKWCVAAI